MKIRDVRVMLLTAKIPEDKQYTSDLGTVVSQSAAIVIVETDEASPATARPRARRSS